MKKLRLKPGDLLIFKKMNGSIAILTARRDKFSHFATTTKRNNKKTIARWWEMTFTHGGHEHPLIYYSLHSPYYDEKRLIRQIKNGQIEWHSKGNKNENEHGIGN